MFVTKVMNMQITELYKKKVDFGKKFIKEVLLPIGLSV